MKTTQKPAKAARTPQKPWIPQGPSGNQFSPAPIFAPEPQEPIAAPLRRGEIVKIHEVIEKSPWENWNPLEELKRQNHAGQEATVLGFAPKKGIYLVATADGETTNYRRRELSPTGKKDELAHKVFARVFPEGSQIRLVKNQSGKGLGPRTVLRISEKEVEFLVAHAQWGMQKSVATLKGVMVQAHAQGLSIFDPKQRLLAEYHKA
jgi:hypothetical protein